MDDIVILWRNIIIFLIVGIPLSIWWNNRRIYKQLSLMDFAKAKCIAKLFFASKLNQSGQIDENLEKIKKLLAPEVKILKPMGKWEALYKIGNKKGGLYLYVIEDAEESNDKFIRRIFVEIPQEQKAIEPMVLELDKAFQEDNDSDLDKNLENIWNSYQ